ncbi:hypothetical protein EHO59_07255 [Leptospira semungkisensis]|uniref:Uncharacterized protein n=1 Tax=Leptospira semungkisensis TaxID=2484985 RepID=A0A4R9G8M2_9LEPT|nr:YbhN family protein [Leptospira semungkisensis]TGK07883.1 hypothetical protein EHO59_07255 [Leptospira semungkisensis]
MSIKSIKKISTFAFLLLAFSFFVYYIFVNYKNLPQIHWNSISLFGSIGSVFLYSLNILAGGLIWHVLLRDYGVTISVKESIHIVCLAQFGKYLPGNVGQHIGRVAIANEKKIPAAITLQTILMESILLAVIGISISLVGFFAYEFANLNDSRGFILQMVVICLGALFLPKILILLANKFAKGKLEKLAGGNPLRIPNFSALSIAALLYVFTFVNLGIILDIIAKTIFQYSESNIFFLTTAFAWSWILGYLAPGAPAGLGVREAVIIASLSSKYDPGIAIGLSIVLRFITTIGDGAVFLVALAFKNRSFLKS